MQVELTSFADAPSRARRVVQNGDSLFGTVRPYLQSHGFIPVGQQGPIIASTGFCVIRAKAGLSDPGYLFHSIMGLSVYEQANRHAIGSSYPAVTDRDVAAFRIHAPPLPHQSKIAEILDTLDDAIRGTGAVVAKLAAMKQGLLHDLLTRGIDHNGDLRPPYTSAPKLYHQTPLGWLPKGWEEMQLSDVADVDRGRFTHRPRNDPAFYGGNIPFIQTGDVAAAKGDYVTSYSQTLNERGAAVSKEFPKGTIAITIAANIADTGILAFPMCFPDSVVGAVVREGVNIRFVELWIRQAKRRLDARAPQSAQKNINLQDLRPLAVFLPSKEEQIQIGETYDALHNKLQAETTLLAKLRLQKSGLMEDLLTGRVSVAGLLEPERSANGV